MRLSSLDVWRLAEDLTVLQASVLISGGDPSIMLKAPVWMLTGGTEREQELPNIRIESRTSQKDADALAKSLRDQAIAIRDMTERVRPLFDVLKCALQNDRLEGTFVFDLGENDSSSAQIRTHTGRFSEAFSSFGEREDPDWDKTTVFVEHLKQWLDKRNLYPEFFFPGPQENSFENPKHERYSPELACAAAAWRAVTRPDPNKSVKATLDDWVAANAVSFGVNQGNGTPSQQSKDRIATLVNWQKKGGAPATPNASSS